MRKPYIMDDRRVLWRTLRDVAWVMGGFFLLVLLARGLPPLVRGVVVVGAGGVTLALLVMVLRWAASERGALIFPGWAADEDDD
jgi:hypothetical protein